MTDLSLAPSIAASQVKTGMISRRAWTPVLYAAGLVAGGAGAVVALRSGDDAGSIEWRLSLLLRFMAIVKGAMVVAAFGLTQWRLRAPIGTGLATAYIGALAAMALAPGLIWSMEHIILGAACFHAGLLMFLVVAWRDGAVRMPSR